MKHNINLEERFRFTMQVKTDGMMGFSCIGMHTMPELIGYLQIALSILQDRCKNKSDSNLLTDMTDLRSMDRQ